MKTVDELIDEFISGQCCQWHCLGRNCKRAANGGLDITSFREPWDMEKGTLYHPGHLLWGPRKKWVQIIASNYPRLIASENFDDLYSQVYELTGSVRCLQRDLIAYDTALAIAIGENNSNLLPVNVYLHLNSARAAKKLGINGDIVSKDVFVSKSPGFAKLSPAMIEWFLSCVVW